MHMANYFPHVSFSFQKLVDNSYKPLIMVRSTCFRHSLPFLQASEDPSLLLEQDELNRRSQRMN